MKRICLLCTDYRKGGIMGKDKNSMSGSGGLAGGTYFFAMVGSAIYFIQSATSFGDGLLGVIKAIFWPATLLYKAMEHLH